MGYVSRSGAAANFAESGDGSRQTAIFRSHVPAIRMDADVRCALGQSRMHDRQSRRALDGRWLPWRRGPKTSLDDFLAQHGYMPALHPGEKETIAEVHPFERRQAISVTEAQSYDDWSTAQLARAL